MISIPFIVIFGGLVFGVYRWGDAAVSHLLAAAGFGLFLGATPAGPAIQQGLTAGCSAIAQALS